MTIVLEKENQVPNKEKLRFHISQWWGEDWEGEVEGYLDEAEDIKSMLEDEARLRGMSSPHVTLYYWVEAPNDKWESDWIDVNDAWDEAELDEWLKDWKEKGIEYSKSDFNY